MRAHTLPGLAAVAVILGVCTVAPAAKAVTAPISVTVATNTTVTGVGLHVPGGIPQAARPGIRPRGAESPAATTAQNFLDAVSCKHVGDCIAVGGNDSGNGGNGAPVSELWNGSTWRAVPTPLPKGAGGGELYGVTCVTGGCVAVGYYYPSTRTENPASLVEVWTGNHWAVPRQPPMPGGASSALLAVDSCQTATNCLGVGYFIDGKDTVGLVESWTGSGYTYHDLRAPAGSTSYSALGSISCPAAGTCVAVGTFGVGHHYDSLTDVLSGGRWRQVLAPSVSTQAGDQNVLQSVSCASASMCEAVGTAGAPSGKNFYTNGYAEGWNGSGWFLQKASWPAGSHSAFYSVDCPSASYCLAVGGIGPYSTYNNGHIAANVWTGSPSWTGLTLPTASGGTGSVFYGNTCLAGSTVNCIAAGEVGPAKNAGHGLSGFFNGAAWKLITTS